MYIGSQWVKQTRCGSCKECQIEFITTNPQKQYCTDTCKTNFNSRLFVKRHSSDLGNYLYSLLKTRPQISQEQLQKLYDQQGGLCALTNVSMTWQRGIGRVSTNISIDRIVPGSDYVIENVRLVCTIVNSMRSNMTDKELLKWCSLISSDKQTC